ncbi:MAG: hypothetical protein AAFX85_02745 [Pseudomonadota bacterium]
MSKDYSPEGLLAFLREAAMAGRLNPATARSRLHAAQRLFGQLTAIERADLRQLDVTALVARCQKADGDTMRPEVLRVYEKRMSDALADYLRFVEDPDQFVATASERRSASAHRARTQEEQALERAKLSITNARPDIVPVPIGDDKVVYIQNLPADLTVDQARKITRVIDAFVDDSQERDE